MTARNLLFCISLPNAEKVYTHAANYFQAARALTEKLGYRVYVQDLECCSKIREEVKPMKVYTFQRKRSQYDSTVYEEVLAKSEKQAWFYFLNSRGKQWFARIEMVREATKEDLSTREEGSFRDVTW